MKAVEFVLTHKAKFSYTFNPKREFLSFFNRNDRFLRDRVEGVFCEVESPKKGFEAKVVIVVS